MCRPRRSTCSKPSRCRGWKWGSAKISKKTDIEHRFYRWRWFSRTGTPGPGQLPSLALTVSLRRYSDAVVYLNDSAIGGISGNDDVAERPNIQSQATHLQLGSVAAVTGFSEHRLDLLRAAVS